MTSCYRLWRTGARKSDILGARWADIHLSRNLWTIPNPKNEVPYEVRLSAEALAVFTDGHHRVTDEYVFPSGSETGHVLNFKRSWLRLLRRAGIAGLRIHDLRRTFGSAQAIAGSSLLVIGKSLGQSSIAATEVYYAVRDSAPAPPRTSSNPAGCRGTNRWRHPVSKSTSLERAMRRWSRKSQKEFDVDGILDRCARMARENLRKHGVKVPRFGLPDVLDAAPINMRRLRTALRNATDIRIWLKGNGSDAKRYDVRYALELGRLAFAAGIDF